MNIIEQIKAEIERRWEEAHSKYKETADQYYDGMCTALDHLEIFLDTLESERPEPYNPVYDEAYLNEKIKKATESWKGVDVDAMLAECRGYDEEKSEKPMNQDEELNEEIKRYIDEYYKEDSIVLIAHVARHFAQWGADHTPLPEDTVLFNKGVEEGKRLMMEEAEECELYWDGDFLTIDLNMTALGYSDGDKVRVIVIPNTDEK